MDATCAQCGTTFSAATKRAKYCDGKCKKRAADARKRNGSSVVRLAPSPPPAPALEFPSVVEALTSTYSQATLASPAGQLALRLAAEVDVPGDRPGFAALARELRASLDALQSSAAPAKANPLTLIRERHAGGRASG